MPLDLLCLGEAYVEISRTEPDLPLSKPGTFSGPYPSGGPCITAVQAARLGARAGIITAIGSDPFGDSIRAQLDYDGVDTRGLVVLDDFPTAVVFNTSDSNLTEAAPYVRHSAAGQLLPARLNLDMLDDLGCLHVSACALMLNNAVLAAGYTAWEHAGMTGARRSLDLVVGAGSVAPHAYRMLTPFIETADVIRTTSTDFRRLTGADSASDWLLDWAEQRPGRIGLVTRAQRGSSVVTADGHDGVPGFRVTEIDAAGAGDCFSAGFLIWWMRGMPPAQAARFANACGALAVTQQGPMSGAMPLETVRIFMEGRRVG